MIMDPDRPSLDILICTVARRLFRIPGMLLPERNGIRYIVSVQYDSTEPPVVPAVLESRTDITVSLTQGTGLSKNRNNALSKSGAEICLIADDDNRYKPEYIDTLLKVWTENPDADIITFQAETLEGNPLHTYPAPYVCSVEISFRRASVTNHDLKFDERFGLGSPLLCAGEEDVFIADARRAGLVIRYVPKTIVQTNGTTTSASFANDSKLQITKGATFRYVYGTGSAILRSFREASWYLFHKGVNPIPILYNMLKGIWILR